MQVYAAVSEGFWYARSAEFLQQPVMQMLVWLRMPGDILFSIGVLLLVAFVGKLWLGKAGARRRRSRRPTGGEPRGPLKRRSRNRSGRREAPAFFRKSVPGTDFRQE